MDDFIKKHAIEVESSEPHKGGTRYHLTSCAWNGHTDGSATLFVQSDGTLGANCNHNSCEGLGWTDYRKVFEPDAYTPKKQRKNKATQDEKEAKPKEEHALIRLMRIANQAKLICTPSGDLHARVPVNGHDETVTLSEKGSGFRRWLVHEFKRLYGFAPNSDALSQTMSGVLADAEYSGQKNEVHTRIAEKDGCIYLDLANDKWECVEISTDGWRVITCPPVFFRRPSGMLPLPNPIRGGSIDDLRELINAKDDRDYVLITAWLVGALHPKGPYPALNLNGERGSTKSKTTTLLRNLIDPNIAPTRTVPQDDREAAITAQNNMIIALDNLSSMPLWLSDMLCRLATGSGFATRELYTDAGERVFNARRPIIMNGIEDGIITQGDLLSRTMMVTLTPPDEYLSEEEIDDLFAAKHPSLLGALLSIASVALRDRKSVHLDSTPRMADFAKWVTAAEPALKWKKGTFMEVYTENQDTATTIVTESSPVAQAIIQFMGDRKRNKFKNEWKGLIGNLLDELMIYDVFKDAKKAPKAANKLSGHLKRIAPLMRVQGIDIQYLEHTKTGRIVSIQMIPGDDTGDDTHIGDDPKKVSSPVSSPPSKRGEKPAQAIILKGGDDGDDVFSFESGLEKKKKDSRKYRVDKEENSSSLSSLSSLSSPNEPVALSQSGDDTGDDTFNLQREYRHLFLQVGKARKQIAPHGNILWRVPESGYEDIEQVDTTEYQRRLKEIHTSGDRRRLTAGRDEMLRKLEALKK